MKEITKEYTNGEITIVWKPKTCIHAGTCVKMLPEVYKPKEKPWIQIDNATTEALKEQIMACPSGALSYRMNNEQNLEKAQTEIKVEALANGPLLVYGTLHVTNSDGSQEVKKRTTAFCRCGVSQNKPYCDGAHNNANFIG